MKTIHRLVFFGFASMLWGCANVPTSIQVENSDNLVGYQQVAANPSDNVNKPARWGGVVARVENLPDATMVEMVHYPLRAYGRPLESDNSVGRFRVYVDGFLDPLVFDKGRAVTFSGSVVGIEEGSVGEHQYKFPTIKSQGYHLWKEINRTEVSSVHLWSYQPFWGLHYRPYHQRVIIRNRGGRDGNTSSPRAGAVRNTGNRGSSSRPRSGNSGGSVKEY